VTTLAHKRASSFVIIGGIIHAPIWAAPRGVGPWIIDLAKLVRTALQDAGSVAGLLVTTARRSLRNPSRMQHRPYALIEISDVIAKVRPPESSEVDKPGPERR